MNEREALEKQAEHLIRVAEVTELVGDLNDSFSNTIGLQDVTVEKLNEEFSSETEVFEDEKLKKVVNKALSRLRLRLNYFEVME